MITLEIRNADGSLYWTEYADKAETLIAWVKEESTRSYWDSSRTWKLIDDGDEMIVSGDKADIDPIKRAERELKMKNEKDAIKAKQDRVEQAKQFAKAYRGKTFKNLAEASNAFEHLFVAAGLDDT